MRIFLCFIVFFSGGSFALECADQIRAAICLVDPVDKTDQTFLGYIQNELQRPCNQVPVEIEAQVLRVAKMLPAQIQPVLCEVRRLFIEKKFYATAYAGTFYELLPEKNKDETVALQATGWVVGLHRDRVFKNSQTISAWLTSKEQTLFGLEVTEPTPEELPRFTQSWQGVAKDDQLLYNVLVHEIGHLLDIANSVNSKRLKCSGENFKDCIPVFESLWPMITWDLQGEQLEGPKYWPAPLCYYGCPNDKSWMPIPLSEAKTFYEAFRKKSGFVSTYASVNPHEDFAESLTYFFLKEGDGDYGLEFSREFSFSLNSRWSSNRYLKAKSEYLKLFLSSPFQVKPDPTIIHYEPNFELRFLHLGEGQKETSLPFVIVD